MAYKAPNIEVNQNFNQSPSPVAVERLAPMIIATAYNVKTNVVIGAVDGLENTMFAYGQEKVVFDKSVSGRRVYEAMPLTVFAETPFGDIDVTENSAVSKTGINVQKDLSYEIPGAKGQKIPTASMPYRHKVMSSGDCSILKNTRYVELVGESINSDKLVRQQNVFVKEATGFVVVGQLDSISPDGKKIYLISTYTGDDITASKEIIIGGSNILTPHVPDVFHDSSATFRRWGVKPGDFITGMFSGDVTEFSATVLSIIDDNTLILNTAIVTDPVSSDLTLTKVLGTEGATVKSYTVKRYMGRSYRLNTTGQAATISATDKTFFTVTNIHGAKTGGKVTVGSDVRKIEAIVDNAGVYSVYVDIELTVATGALAFFIGNASSTTIKASYRSINTAEQGRWVKINGNSDIIDAYGEISLDNDLAFLVSAAQASAGGNAVYAINVSSESEGLFSAYAEALEESKKVDCYALALGTTDGGVQAMLPAYCDSESLPSNKHERVAYTTFDQEDVWFITSGDATYASGIITLASRNPILIEDVRKGDIVEAYDASGDTVGTLTITSTPKNDTELTVEGDLSGVVAKVDIRAGDKDSQMIRIGALSTGNRRITTICPGYFYGEVADVTRLIPPYVIAAVYTGLDSGDNVATSRTNNEYSIPGVSKIELGTQSDYKSTQLDLAAEKGINIQVQSLRVTNVISSRHDLTNNMSSVEFATRSVTKQVDIVAKTIRNSVASYLGKYPMTQAFFDTLKMQAVVGCGALTSKPRASVAAVDVKSVAAHPKLKTTVVFDVDVTVFLFGEQFVINLNINS